MLKSFLLENPNEIIYATILSIIILFIISFSLQRHIPEWEVEGRGFESLHYDWVNLFTYSFVFSFIFGMLTWYMSEGSIILLILSSVVSYTLFFSSYTDLKVHKAPREVSNYSFVIASFFVALTLIMSYNTDYYSEVNVMVDRTVFFQPLYVFENIIHNQLLNMFMWFLIIFIIQLVSRGGLGMADVRIFMLLGVSLSWWVGFSNMLILFAALNILQALIFIPGTIFKWGTMITLPSGKERRAIPFIPVISVVSLAGVLYFAEAAVII
jgi:hypothetical protein